MEFQQIMQQFTGATERDVTLQIPESWGQGRAVFGGLAAALAYRLLEGQLAGGQVLRSLTLSFIAPLTAGIAQCQCEILRSGKSVQQTEVRLLQNGEPVLVMLASFGVARASSVQYLPPPAPQLNNLTPPLVLPKQEPAPEFTRHFDYQIMEGGLPFSGVQANAIAGRIRMAGPRQTMPCGVAELLALVDAWPPATLMWLTQPAPASSLCWTFELITSDFSASATDWWQYQAEIEAADAGYHHIASKLWDAQGKLIAISRQTVTLFA